MTDPVSRENFAKYGSPDGPHRFISVGVAMPKSIEEPENHLLVLSVFFIVIIVIIPAYFHQQLRDLDHDPCGAVSVKNRSRFARLYDDKLRAALLPGILGQGIELQNMKVRNQKELEMLKKIRSMPQASQAFAVQYGEPEAALAKMLGDEETSAPTIQVKPTCLLLAQMYGLHDWLGDDEETAKEMEQILRILPIYIEVIMGSILGFTHMQRDGLTRKQFTAMNILSVL